MQILLRLFVLTSSWLFAMTGCAVAHGKPALTLTIIPTTYVNRDSLTAAISLEGSLHFHVLLTNVSATPVTVFQEDNSWGYYSLSFDLTYADGRKERVGRAFRYWYKNFPSTITLPPKGSYVFEVNFDETWNTSIRLQPTQGQQGVTCRLRATYAIAPRKSPDPTLDFLKVSTWTGTIRSAEMPCIVYK